MIYFLIYMIGIPFTFFFFARWMDKDSPESQVGCAALAAITWPVFTMIFLGVHAFLYGFEKFKLTMPRLEKLYDWCVNFKWPFWNKD